MSRGEPMKNESGIKQVYYWSGIKHVCPPGGIVPDEHLSPALRDTLSTPVRTSERSRPRRPVKRLVPAGPGRTIAVSAAPSRRGVADALRSMATVSTARPGDFPPWVRYICTENTARWEILPGFWLPEDESARPAVLAYRMRSVLNGEGVSGLRFYGERFGSEEFGKRPLVVLPVHGAPEWAVPLVERITSSQNVGIEFDLVVVDDGSDPLAFEALYDALGAFEEEREGYDAGVAENAFCYICSPSQRDGLVYLVRIEPGPNGGHGYVSAANAGSKFFDPEAHDLIVFLNSDTHPGNGWLSALRRAVYSAPDVGFAVPLSAGGVTDIVPLPPGATVDGFADALVIAHDGSYPETFAPAGFCWAVRPDVWQKYGPFDFERWGEGYGEETDVMITALEDGIRAVRAPDAYVAHAGAASYGDAARSARVKTAIEKIRKYHPDFSRLARDHMSRNAFSDTAARVSTVARIQGPDARKRIALVCKTTRICGGVLAMFHLRDALERIGWDAVICSVVEAHDLDLYPPRSGVFVFGGESDFRANFARDVFEEGVVVSASWVTSECVSTLCENHEGLRGIAYVQDDERRFRHNRGYEGKVVAAWRSLEPVANADWVADVVEEEVGKRPDIIPVGVDELLFRPRPDIRPDVREKRPIRVIGMSRPSTPHRGTRMLIDGIASARRRGVEVDFRLFGQRPPGGFLHTYLGVLPPEEVARETAAADILVDASTFQGFGMPAVQAISCGTALITSHNGGSAMYATHKNAVILNELSADAIGQAIEELDEDRDLLRAIQDRARGTISLSWDEIALRWDEYLTAPSNPMDEP